MKQSLLLLLVCRCADSFNDIVHLICLLIAKHYGILQYF